MDNQTIAIKNLTRKTNLNPTKIKTILRKILNAEKIKQANVSVVFVSDQKMRKINNNYLSHDYVTDILTFDLSDHSCSHEIEGEIFIAPGVVERNAKAYGVSFWRELTLYLIHGILHLRGYDDKKEADVKRMRKREGELLKMFYN